MVLTTKFDLGDTVYHVFNMIDHLLVKCQICEGAGKMKVVGVDKFVQCPRCYGKGTEHSSTQIVNPTIQGPYTIGQVRITERAEPTMRAWQPRELREEDYMMQETGIESGTVYRAANLYATRAEAEAEQARRRQESIDRAALAGHDVSNDG